uniref:Uncharacterized protein n=1 Tax=Strongyloides papillosus TaxID=174720 RepID=A0A0N5BSI9_STREA
MVDETGMHKILRALKDKERNRPPFRKNNGQSSYKNYNRSFHSNGSQSLHWDNNQRSTKGPKIPSVYKIFRIYSESDNSKDTDSQQFSKAPNNQQFSEGPDNQRFSKNHPDTGSETFDNSEFARRLRARNGQPLPSDFSEDEASTSHKSVAPYFRNQSSTNVWKSILRLFENFLRRPRRDQRAKYL